MIKEKTFGELCFERMERVEPKYHESVSSYADRMGREKYEIMPEVLDDGYTIIWKSNNKDIECHLNNLESVKEISKNYHYNGGELE